MITAKRYGVSTKSVVGGAILALALTFSACVTGSGIPQPLAPVRTVNVSAWSWGYEPAFLRVTSSQVIRLNLTSLDVAHSLTCESLGIDQRIPERGAEPVVLEFHAPEPGEYEFHSTTASGPGVSHMRLKLVVMR